VLESGGAPRRRAGPGPRLKREREATAAPVYTGPYASAGPYEDDGPYEVRLERVPGGLRLAEWAGGSIRRRAPTLPAPDLAGLVVAAAGGEMLSESDAEALREALAARPAAGPSGSAGVSAGRAGELREELRVERIGDGDRVRLGRWLLRPGSGWELQQAPVMLPAKRYAEALAGAARSGALVSGVAGAARPD
jgi:hypothetical protein